VPKPNVPTEATQEQSVKPKQKTGLKQVTLDRTFAQVIKDKKQEQTKEAKTDATIQTYPRNRSVPLGSENRHMPDLGNTPDKIISLKNKWIQNLSHYSP
jgi:hypothetical protein